MAQVSYGSITIIDSTDIERIYVVYAKSSSGTDAPSMDASTWTESIATAPGTGDYIWHRIATKKTGIDAPIFGNPVCVTGPDGRGINSIYTYYCNYGNGTPASSSDRWQSTVPTYDANYPNYWVKTVINYTEGDPGITIYKNNGITESIGKAVEALDLAKNTNYAWWSLSQPKTVGPNTFAAGSYGTYIKAEVFQNNPTNKSNVFLDSGGIYLRNGLESLLSITGTALTFYNPSDHTSNVVLDSGGLKVSKGGIIGGSYNETTKFIYLSTEDYSGPAITINGNSSDWRQIIGNKFGVKNDGSVYATNAHISGTIYANAGAIGGAEIIDGQLAVNQNQVVDLVEDLEEISKESEIKGYNLIVNTDYSTAQTVTMTAHVYYGEEEVTSNFPPTLFYWYLKSEDGIVPYSTGYSKSFNRENAGYGSTMVCSFAIDEDVTLITPNNYVIVTPDGYGLLAKV